LVAERIIKFARKTLCAELLHIAGITFPSGDIQKRLLLELYNEAGVDPSAVSYVELHGTGTPAGDPEEANSVAEVFCGSNRTSPLLIGSTKSNMGHPEPVAGLAAMAKVIIAMHSGSIPGNLHYHEPNPNIPALTDGRFKVRASLPVAIVSANV
jgi:fatty acid synthase